jgi:hypothetical protein
MCVIRRVYSRLRDVGRNVSITWFASAPASGGDPQTLLMAFMAPELNKDGGTLNWSIQLLVAINPTSGAPMPAGSTSPMIMCSLVVGPRRPGLLTARQNR